MALPGNHGRILPRSKSVYERLYFTEGLTLVQIGRIYGVTHKSVSRVMDQLGIERRQWTVKAVCRECGGKFRPDYKANGGRRGRICDNCYQQYQWKWIKGKMEKCPAFKARVKADRDRYYVEGAAKPTREESWLRKGRLLLRTARRASATGSAHPSPSGWRNAELGRERISRDSCPP